MNFDYDEISQSQNRQKDLNKIHLIKECSNQFNKEKQNLSAENETNDETVKKSIENNFKLDLNDDIYNNEDSVFQEGNNSVTEQSLNFFENKSSQIEDNKNVEEKKLREIIKKMKKQEKLRKNPKIKAIIQFLILKKNLIIVWIILKRLLWVIFWIMQKRN